MKCYIKYLNKDKSFTEDKKDFKSYEDAKKWSSENFDTFNSDSINYY